MYQLQQKNKQIISKAIDQWAVVFIATGLLFKTRKVAPCWPRKRTQVWGTSPVASLFSAVWHIRLLYTEL